MGRRPCSHTGRSEALAERGASVELALIELDEPDDNEIDTSFAVIGRLAEEVRSAVDAGAFPVVLSGSCFAAVGVVAGLGEPASGRGLAGRARRLQRARHLGLRLSRRHGAGDSGGRRVAGARRAGPGVQRDRSNRRCCSAAAATFDEPEVARLEASDIRLLDADSLGDPVAVGDAVQALDVEPRGLYLHIDLDVLDASVARVNRYAASGGVDRRRARAGRPGAGRDRPGARGLFDRLRARARSGGRGAPDRHEAARRGRRIAPRHSFCSPLPGFAG